MQKIFVTCCLTGSSLIAAPLALAQTATDTPPAKPATSAKPQQKEAAPVTPQVTVAGERPTNRIDRQVYDVKSDVSSTNGSAADALNNVPSVNVDPDGTVTLRGSTNVQIMIDGKPSAMLQGDNRGPALQAMPADDVESVEVINHPGAEFGNEAGGGPILNLVMRRNRKPGGLATVNANYSGNAAQVMLSIAGQGAVQQWIRNGSLGQTVTLAADNQFVSNQMEITLIRQAITANTQLALDVAHSIQSTHGLGH